MLSKAFILGRALKLELDTPCRGENAYFKGTLNHLCYRNLIKPTTTILTPSYHFARLIWTRIGRMWAALGLGGLFGRRGRGWGWPGSRPRRRLGISGDGWPRRPLGVVRVIKIWIIRLVHHLAGHIMIYFDICWPIREPWETENLS